jgi:hypothetical protein
MAGFGRASSLFNAQRRALLSSVQPSADGRNRLFAGLHDGRVDHKPESPHRVAECRCLLACGGLAGFRGRRLAVRRELSEVRSSVVGMDDRDVEMLRLANARYRFEGARAVDVRERFGLSLTRFWQAVNALLDDETVIRAHPGLVLPLRRQREQQGRLRRAG